MTTQQTWAFLIGMVLIVLSVMEFWHPYTRALVG